METCGFNIFSSCITQNVSFKYIIFPAIGIMLRITFHSNVLITSIE